MLQERTFPEIGGHGRRATGSRRSGWPTSSTRSGRANPGAITLHNFPRFLQTLRAARTARSSTWRRIDILRIRERGVPRYNDFRRLLHLKPARTFEELTDNPVWAEELRRVYGDVERVDLMVGLFAEPLPKGFGFSDTAFRVFILMASRRLKSDRFFTRDYTPRTYTQEGLDWIADNDMITVLLRHFPDLAPALQGRHERLRALDAGAGGA